MANKKKDFLTAQGKRHFKKAIKRDEQVAVAGLGEDTILVINEYITFTCHRYDFARVMQPIVLRPAPEEGEAYTVSGHIEKTAEEWKQWWLDFISPATQKVYDTGYM